MKTSCSAFWEKLACLEMLNFEQKIRSLFEDNLLYLVIPIFEQKVRLVAFAFWTKLAIFGNVDFWITSKAIAFTFLEKLANVDFWKP